MNCTEVKEMLWAYLEKEITAEEAVKIEEHLANCAECREELEIQKEIMDSLQSLHDEELPEGYHTELMQKLQAEAAPNVVPFPVKKKKQPRWKQLSLVAAAVLVVVAAGGMDGILSMRETQNAVVQEMKAADTATPVESSVEETAGVTMDMAAEVQEDGSAAYKNKKMNAPVTGVEMAAETEETTAAYDSYAALPETASLDAAEEESLQFSIMRSAEVNAVDTTVLEVSDTAIAMAELQKAIAEAGGYEEAAEEGSIFAVIPVENYGDFVQEIEKIGMLEWTQKGKIEEEAAYRTIEIQLK